MGGSLGNGCVDGNQPGRVCGAKVAPRRHLYGNYAGPVMSTVKGSWKNDTLDSQAFCPTFSEADINGSFLHNRIFSFYFSIAQRITKEAVAPMLNRLAIQVKVIVICWRSHSAVLSFCGSAWIALAGFDGCMDLNLGGTWPHSGPRDWKVP